MEFRNVRGLLTGATLLCAAILASTPALAQIVFDGNILFGNGNLTQAGQYRTDNFDAAACGAAAPAITGTQQLAELAYNYNRYVDPLLTAALNLGAPVWRPGAGSPALPTGPNYAAVNVPNDGWFEQTCYVGALDGAEAADWTRGWTYYDSTGAGRTDLDFSRPVAILDNFKFGGAYAMANDTNYVLRGQVRVLDGGVLTIEAGTQVFGEAATVGTLIIERGGRILAAGTAQQPIIFTSDALPGSYARGGWGGINILGRARANCIGANAPAEADTCASEGGAIGIYGGTDDADSSGVLRYVRVEYSGKEITTDNELNAFTFNALGSRTVLEYLQAHRCADDGLEFFGGTAGIKRSLATDGTDDGLDWQLGWRGKAQFIVVRTSAELTPSQGGGAGQAGDKGIEADNFEFGFDNLPRSNPTVANLTLIGDRRSGASFPGGTNGIQLRRGTTGAILNSVVYNHKNQALRITDTATWTAACGAGFPQPGLFCGAGVAVTPVAEGSVFLSRGAPNPFRSQVAIRFALPVAADVKVNLYAANGRRVANLHDGPLSSGEHAIQWSAGEDVPAGLYFYRVEAGGRVSQGKLVRAE